LEEGEKLRNHWEAISRFIKISVKNPMLKKAVFVKVVVVWD
jgi:hypothetical protein